MSTVLVSSTDPRGAKAVAIAADAGQWLKCRSNDGRKAYGIPSSTGRGAYHLATRTSCTCKDFLYGRGRDCKHVLAVQLHVALVAEQRAPVSHGVIPASQIERED
jgi:predicted nucleic acid-binding Zn finger protein